MLAPGRLRLSPEAASPPANSGAQGAAAGSPGVLSGNVIQAPVHVPVNLCGDTVSVDGLLSPAFGNTSANGSDGWGHHGHRASPTWRRWKGPSPHCTVRTAPGP
ncbi:chaplin [Streptomyces sp. NPDC052225]|uniref:chaplin n=1 Tax=Streptomyces sp. NPDC052225 TaxID=3154949 RepID=UPI00342FFA33